MSQVIINDVPPYTQATATAGQTVFGTNWTADVASDVWVYQTPAGSLPNDLTQKLSYPSQYSVAFIGGLNQVQVTLVTGASIGDIVTITRQTPADRLNLYSNTNFVPTMLNNDFGILTLVDQQAQLVNQLIGPRYNYSTVIRPIIDTILPRLGANQFWLMNEDQTAIEAVVLPGTSFAPIGLSYLTFNDESAFLPESAQLIAGAGITLTTVGRTYVVSSPGGTVVSITGNNGILANPDPIIGSGSLGLAPIATLTGLVNTTGLSAVPIATTLTAWIDAAIGSVQGDILYRNGTVWTVLLPGTTGQLLQTKGAAANPAYTTATYPATTTINQLLYSSANNVVVGLATGNDSVLITSAGGVPSLSTVLPGGLTTTDPTLTQGIATKHYVDQTALNGTSVYAASAGSLGTVTQSGAGAGATLTNAGAQATFALDGVNPPVGVNVLIKNTATGMAAANEGIYTVTSVGSGATNWVLTRATSYDTATEINNTGLILIQNGSTLAGTAWYNAATIVTVDTTAFSYSQFGNIIFPITVVNGGTGVNSLTAYAPIFGGTTSTNPVQSGTVGTLGQVLTSNGPGAIATFQAAATSGFTSVVMQVFTSSGTYTPTANMKYCIIEAVGGGGGGGGASGVAATSSGAGGGGGGGEYARSVKTAAQVGASQTVTIGAGGAGGAAGANNGANGNNTSVGTLVIANLGSGGNLSVARATADFGGGGGSGGTGGTGNFIIVGGAGGLGVVVNGALGVTIIGRGGHSFFGMGSAVGNASGSSGSLYGSGGDGANASGANAAGNAGAAGVVVITEYI